MDDDGAFECVIGSWAALGVEAPRLSVRLPPWTNRRWFRLSRADRNRIKRGEGMRV